jgi:hypothetical protein
VPCTSSPSTRSSSTLTTSKSSSTTSSKMLPVLFSRSALEERVSTSLHQSSPSSTSRQSVLTSTSTSSQLPAFSREGPIGAVGESISGTELSNRSRPLVRLFAMNSLSEGTKKIYSPNWQLFVNFGALHGVNVNLYDWDFSFCCEFLLFPFQNSASLHSVLSARSALNFFWKLNCASTSPTESNFVSLFIKGLSSKYKNVPKKAFPISYEDLTLIFSQIVGDSTLESLSFVKLRFISFIFTLNSSFGRYEEVSQLKISKSYQYRESNIGVVSNLPGLLFNPSRVVSIYIDKVAFLHANSDSPSDYLLPACRYFGRVEHSLDKPVSYEVILKQFKLSVSEAKVEVGLSKVGLHCMRRGGVTHAVRAGAPHPVVKKCMRVKSDGMVGYYATLSGNELNEASKLAF